MKKIIEVLLVILILLPINIVRADNLQYTKDGWQSVEEVQVQIIKSRFNLPYAIKKNSITYNGDFENITNKVYSESEYTEGGAFFQNRDTALSYDILATPESEKEVPIIVYTKPLIAGDNAINGSIVAKFEKAAILQDGTECDVTMTINNIKIKSGRATTKPVTILYTVGKNKDKIAVGISYAKQEATTVDELVKRDNGTYRYKYYDIGATYDLSFVVTKTETQEVVSQNMAISFKDIDSKDYTIENGIYTDENNIPSTYTEGITLINGVEGNVHLTNDSTIQISNTDYGQNTRYSATENDPSDTEKSGFITLVHANNFKMQWSGSHCGTTIDFVSTAKVVTSTIGEYPNNVKITDTDEKVHWKENKSIIMTPDKGYTVKTIEIDNVTIEYQNLTLTNGKRTYNKNDITYTFIEQNGVVTYTFNDVINDHDIKVSVTKSGYIFHYNANGGIGTMEDTIAEFDIQGNTSENTFTRNGYEFVGWEVRYKDSTGNYVPLKDENGQIVTMTNKQEYLNLYGKNKEEVTLFAIWKPITLAINPSTGTFLTVVSIVCILSASILLIIQNKIKLNQQL